MAQFWNEVEGPGSLLVELNVLGVIDPKAGFVQRGAAGYGTGGGLYAIEATFSLGEYPYFRQLTLVPKCTVEEFPDVLVAFMDATDPEFHEQDTGIESADLHILVRREYGPVGEDGFYSFLVVVDTGAAPGTDVVTSGGPAIYFPECRGRTVLDFARTLREETRAAAIVSYRDVL